MSNRDCYSCDAAEITRLHSLIAVLITISYFTTYFCLLSLNTGVISLIGLVLSLSVTAVTRRPQAVITMGIYMSSNIYYYY